MKNLNYAKELLACAKKKVMEKWPSTTNLLRARDVQKGKIIAEFSKVQF